MSHEYCMDHTDPGFAQNVIEGREFCAGIPDENGNGLTDGNGYFFIDGGKGACHGDSGGPLTCVIDDQPVLTGIASRGYGCAEEGKPGIYVDVAHYVDWIEETMHASEPTTPPPTTSTWNYTEHGFEELPEKIPEGLQCTEPFQRQIAVGDDAHRIVNGTVVEKGKWSFFYFFSVNCS